MNPQFPGLRNLVRRNNNRERGQTLILFLLMVVILIVFVGLGVDLGFAYITKAELSKAVDSAALDGMRNINQGTVTASLIASNAFAANYGHSGRDVSAPSLSINFGTVNGSVFMNVSATVAINTYFIRVLPALGLGNWNTLTVGTSAQATRSPLILALVLDRSGSMNLNGGAAALPGAVTNFIAMFDDRTDCASQISFATCASVDVPMTQPFIQKIQDAALALHFDNATASEEGLTNGLVQIASETNVAAQSVVRVMVFFTDGMANTFNYVFPCGNTNIALDVYYDGTLANPAGCSGYNCTPLDYLSSINPSNGVLTANAVTNSCCDSMHFEAENRAERIAYLARDAGYVVYSIGLGNTNDTAGALAECHTGSGPCYATQFPVLNALFLQNVANTSDAQTYNSAQPSGDYAIAEDAGQLDNVFQTIASKILLRLSQ
jgi:Flp pilus assembly protein TadG